LREKLSTHMESHFTWKVVNSYRISFPFMINKLWHSSDVTLKLIISTHVKIAIIIHLAKQI